MTLLVTPKTEEWWDEALQARRDDAEEGHRRTHFDEDEELIDAEMPMTAEDEEQLRPDCRSMLTTSDVMPSIEPGVLNLTNAWPFSGQETQLLREALTCYGNSLVEQQLSAGEVLSRWDEPASVRDAARALATKIIEADARLEDFVVRFPELAINDGSWATSPTVAERQVGLGD